MLVLPLRWTLAAFAALLTPSILGCDAEPSDEAADQADRRAQAEAMLEVDARAPADAAQTRFVLFVGDIGQPPVSLDAIEHNPEFAPLIQSRIVLGGRDANRPANFRWVDADTYTVCAAFGRMTGSREVQDAKIEAAYAAVGGGDLSTEKLMAATELLKKDPTFIDYKVDWRAVPVRCRVIEVTADPASRRITLD